MTFDEIMEYCPTNKSVYDEIKERIGQLVPFVGAGLSVIDFSAGAYPLWEKSLQIIRDQLADETEKEQFDTIINNHSDPERLLNGAQFLEDKLSVTYLKPEFEKLFHPNKLCGKENQLMNCAVWLLPMLFAQEVVTTNLDRVLEMVYKDQGKSLPVFLPGERVGTVKEWRRNHVRFLLKLHGTVEKDGTIEYGNLVFTKKQYDNHYTEGSALVKELREEYRQRILLFLGCSLEEDRTMHVLQGELADGFYNYAIIECREGNPGTRRAELGNRHIRAILYPQGKHEAVRIILEKLLEDTDNPAYQRLRTNLSARKKAECIYSYRADTVSFVGREEEMKKLTEFLNNDASVLWWGIAGPGGAGKSRLAWELTKKAQEADWSARFIKPSEYENLSTLSQEATSKNTLYVADYVSRSVDTLRKWISDTATHERTKKLRILVIDRETASNANLSGALKESFFVEPEWERDLLWSGGDCEKTRFDEVMHLNPLTDEDIKRITNSFAEYLRENDSSIPTPHVDLADKVFHKLQEIDKALLRPLFAMFLTEAMLQNPTGRWGTKTTLNWIVRKERDMINKAIETLSEDKKNESLSYACFAIWITATALGAYGDASIELIRERLPEEWVIVQNHANKYNLRTTEDLLCKIGLISENGNRITALRPDILGEYMVMKWLTDKSFNIHAFHRDSNKAKVKFYKSILLEEELVFAFFKRMFPDWQVLLNEKAESWDELLPEISFVNGESKLAATYSDVLYTSFEWQFKNARKKTAIKTKVLAESQTKKNVETARIYTNMANIYQSLSGTENLSLALEYYEKALELRKKVHGKNHPDTAVIYHNMANVYNDMEGTENLSLALQYLEKALKIWKKVLGENHPDTAVIYNSMAAVYCNLGGTENLSLALQYLEKALNITKKAYGENHPDTAMTYNGMAVVYRFLGDTENLPLALQYHEKALNIYKKSFGEDHTNTALTYSVMAKVYRNLGGTENLSLALECYEKALNIYKNAFGENHTDTAITYNGMATVYRDLGGTENLSLALQCLEKTLEIRKKVLGENHLDTRETRIEISYVRSFLGM